MSGNSNNQQNKPRLIAIAGPTASGKTAASIALCKLIGGEVISCDSMMVYRGMDIGTAKPDAAEMDGVPHYMLDVIEPSRAYSAAEYRDGARACISDIISRGKQPVMCGGTGLYIDVVTRDMSLAGAAGDESVRERLNAELTASSPEAMHARLAAVDSETAARLHPNDTRRVVRALEIYELTGAPMSAQSKRESENDELYDLRLYALTMPRDLLYERINRRVDVMLASGLADEVKRLMALNLPDDSTAMQALGYKEIIQALRGEITLEQAADNVRQRTRNYAKRQLSWLRRDKRVRWLDIMPSDPPEATARRILADMAKSDNK